MGTPCSTVSVVDEHRGFFCSRSKIFGSIFKSNFNTMCKSYAKTTIKRIGIIKKRRKAVQGFMEHDILELLEKGYEEHAFGRIEGLAKEIRRSECYTLINNFCCHIMENLDAISKRKDCPENCKVAVSSLMYAAARFADLPELRKLRGLFSNRYGNSMDAFVSKQLEKLISDPPSKELQLKIMRQFTYKPRDCKQSTEEESKNRRSEVRISETRNLEEQRAPESEHNSSSHVINRRFIPPPYVKSEAAPRSLRTGNDRDKEMFEFYNRRRLDEGFGVQNRASSFPKELRNSSSLDLGSRGYGKAASFSHETRNGHIHPNLPEYEEFIDRLEKLRWARDHAY